ncbi:putative F-box associated interaction domain-containing protein [Helianthus annuus]|uniref:F-box associated interaction domain-containing protein n=1 Tax=Helianthus annuus TaxID=4232 RepID=A0A9K3IXK3_HELAN|nr:putative F-box associated interaction domain-containing protein [Helianthus annuus]KAJ0561747.1 putative F-box associated interaction domain-containing protein [Helianthus annuus]KAJ0568496.1 putative F-box associated interaction domain-containing protein [Helianthus annuus]KAJ0574811.1 putative F-box associated interaction domain-containing protein [Helianthus annuus]KAJ0739142.1 putative F-box associated interaction domain-containing protein [Helianthus annuus]
MFKYYTIVGSSQGLFCFYGDDQAAVLWNPSIRKAVTVVVPAREGIYEIVLGYGICRETADPKIVKIRYITREENTESISCIPWQVEVFTLSTGAWRPPYTTTNLPRILIHFEYYQVVTDVAFYLLATDMVAKRNLIISFDITGEEFREVNPLDCLAHKSICNLSMSKLRESVLVLERGVEDNNPVIYVWMMQDEVPKTFTKLFSVNSNTPYALLVYVRGFRKTGEPIIEIVKKSFWNRRTCSI